MIRKVQIYVKKRLLIHSFTTFLYFHDAKLACKISLFNILT